MNEQKITLELKVEEVNTVLLALSKQPYEIVTGLITEIHNQASKQVEQETVKTEE